MSIQRGNIGNTGNTANKGAAFPMRGLRNPRPGQSAEGMAGELRQVFEQGRLELFYQPIVRLKDGALMGFESLLRWPHLERGWIPPGEFIPVAEQSGLILPLSTWVIEESCWQLGEWRLLGDPESPALVIHINLSRSCLSDPGLLRRLETALAAHGIPGSRLTIEITERVFIDPASILEVLKGIKALGVRIALDDFGTGYSSLSCLHQLPIDTLKVDRSFVAGLSRPGTSEILRVILSLAEGMGIEVIAEGVETELQLEQLVAMGYSQAQGYLLSEPCEREEARELARGGPRPWAKLIPMAIPGPASVNSPSTGH